MAYELDPDTRAHGRRLAELLEQTGRLDEAVEIRGDALRRTLRGLRAGNANVYDVREALQSADVWVPHEGADGETDVTLSMLDAQTIPLFSSPETMDAAMGPGQAHLQVPFTAIVAGWPEGTDAVLDPGSEWALRLPAHTLTPPN